MRASRPQAIELCVFGPSTLIGRDGTHAHAVLAQPKRFALFVYLAIATPHGFHRRDRLVGLFWADLDQLRARAALRKAVHVLRRALGDDAVAGRGDEELAVSLDMVRCDVAEFEHAIDVGQVARALELYRGELLEGFYVPGSGEFERWLDERRAHYRAQAATAAWVLAQRYESEARATLAIDAARRAVTIAPLDERVVRKVLAMLGRLGDRSGAVALYESFRLRAMEDLGVEPSPETTAVIEGMRSRRP